MGCGGSKERKNRVDLKMDPTGNDDIDDMFIDFIVPLQTLTAVSDDILKAERRLQRVTETYLLKNATVEDSITVMLYAFISSVDGDIEKLELTIESQGPYIKAHKDKIDPSFHEVFEAWKFYVDVITDAEKKLKDLPQNIEKLPGKCENLTEQAKEALVSLEVDSRNSNLILKVVQNNVAKVAKAPSVLSKTTDALKKNLDVLNNLSKKYNEEGRKNVIAVAKEIHHAKRKNMKEIILNHWTEKTSINIKLEKPRKDPAKRKPLEITKVGPPPAKKGKGIPVKVVKKEEKKVEESKKEKKEEKKEEKKVEESKKEKKEEKKVDESKKEKKVEPTVEKKEHKHEEKPDHKHEEKVEHKHEEKTEHKHEEKVEHKHEEKVEHKHEEKPDHKNEEKPDHKHEEKVEHKNEEHKHEEKVEHKNEEHKHEEKVDHKKEEHGDHKKEDHGDHKKEDHSDHKKEDHSDHKKEDHSDHKKEEHADHKKEDHADHKKEEHADHKKQEHVEEHKVEKAEHKKEEKEDHSHKDAGHHPDKLHVEDVDGDAVKEENS